MLEQQKTELDKLIESIEFKMRICDTLPYLTPDNCEDPKLRVYVNALRYKLVDLNELRKEQEKAGPNSEIQPDAHKIVRDRVQAVSEAKDQLIGYLDKLKILKFLNSVKAKISNNEPIDQDVLIQFQQLGTSGANQHGRIGFHTHNLLCDVIQARQELDGATRELLRFIDCKLAQ